MFQINPRVQRMDCVLLLVALLAALFLPAMEASAQGTCCRQQLDWCCDHKTEVIPCLPECLPDEGPCCGDPAPPEYQSHVWFRYCTYATGGPSTDWSSSTINLCAYFEAYCVSTEKPACRQDGPLRFVPCTQYARNFTSNCP